MPYALSVNVVKEYHKYRIKLKQINTNREINKLNHRYRIFSVASYIEIEMASQANEMYDLYLVVHLNGLQKNVCVPDFWCDSFNLAQQINEGLNRNVNHLIFYSSDLTKEPDFSLPILNGRFDDANDHCYFGKVIRTFSK